MTLPKAEIDRDVALRMWFDTHSDYAKEQFLLGNKGIIAIVLKSLNLDIFNEDLYSTGLVGLVMAVNNFDPEKGVKFSTFATTVITNEILKTFRKKRVDVIFSLDDTANIGNGEEIPYSDILADNKRFEEDVINNILVKKALKKLSKRERKIISLYIKKKTQREIAEIIGLSQAQVSRILKSACGKCKRELEA